jgi:putrescine aminotransferase
VHEHEVFDGDLGVGMLCRTHMFAAGIIMRAVGERMIVAPPLVMTRAEIDEMVQRIGQALDATMAALQAKELWQAAPLAVHC